MKGGSSSDDSEWNIDEKWSTQESVGGQPFTLHTDKFVIDDDDMNSDTVAESDFPLKSRSFLMTDCERC